MNIIKFKGPNLFIVNQIQYLFDQYQFELNNLNTVFFEYDVQEKNNILLIKSEIYKATHTCPVNFKNIFKDIHNHLNDFKFEIFKVYYYPFSSYLEIGEKNVKLNYIHNIILAILVFNPDGFKKENLYMKIWPKDYNISINKLDTHLTNLKELFRSNFNSEIEFKSHKGLIKLIIN